MTKAKVEATRVFFAAIDRHDSLMNEKLNEQRKLEDHGLHPDAEQLLRADSIVQKLEGIEAWSTHLKSIRTCQTKLRSQIARKRIESGNCISVHLDDQALLSDFPEALSILNASPSSALENVSWASRGRSKLNLAEIHAFADSCESAIDILSRYLNCASDLLHELERIDPARAPN